jgi:nucleotide-binding universal stress UspA family protein
VLQTHKTVNGCGAIAKVFPVADALRNQGLAVHIEPAIISEMETILLIDRSRSIDLIVMKECETIENADWHRANSIKVARTTQRPVIAWGPFSSQRSTGSNPGPILAAVSMRESSHQLARAAGQIGRLIGRRLTILHVVDVSHEFSRPDNLAGVECECLLLANCMSAQDVATTVKVEYGPVREAITRFASQEGAELIVMGIDMDEEGREMQQADVLRRCVLMAAPCPVLFLPTFHASRLPHEVLAGDHSTKAKSAERVDGALQETPSV